MLQSSGSRMGVRLPLGYAKVLQGVYEFLIVFMMKF